MSTLATCELHERFLARVKERRLELGLTQKEAADRVGWSQSTWANMENGRNDPSTSTISQVASALQIEPEELLAKILLIHN